ncbi:MAG TPA: class I SAM-dependent methyltransferase [Terrimicrobiaceae bacterium]
MGAFKDHFSGCAEAYSAYRPSYPKTLVDFLASTASGLDLALDCGCGSGQLAVLLAERFAKVVATDASASQIENAALNAKVEYRVAPAERSGLSDSSVDLITAAQAAHWFDLPRFYAEARRVARPHAAIALISYGVLDVEGEPNAIAQRFYREVLGPYWPPERRHVESAYRTFDFPFEEIETPPSSIETSWKLFDLIGYIDTWSAVRELEKRLGRGPVELFQAELARSWGDPEIHRRVRWPLALRVGTV